MNLEMSLDASSGNATIGNDTSSKLSSESLALLDPNQYNLLPAEIDGKMIVENGNSRLPRPLIIDNKTDQNNSTEKGPENHPGFKVSDNPSSKWLIPDLSKGEMPRFGLMGGLQFGFHPGSLNPNSDGGPRGLIRVWSPSLPDDQYCLANFIAVEPTAVGNPEKGYSELEASQGAGDWKPGKLMTVDPKSVQVKEIAPGVEELSLNMDVERFHNGSHVTLNISQRSDQPEELKFKVLATPDSAPIDNCILTATWGNLTRSREIWLKDGMVNSMEIPSYRDYRGYDFSPDQYYGLDRMVRQPDGSAGVAMTTNERHPESIHPVFGSGAWYWGAVPITQYWEVPDPENSLHARVNGRFKYWNSKWARPDGVEVTGGTTFENFEMRTPFRQGQEFVFGVSEKSPEQLGYGQKK